MSYRNTSPQTQATATLFGVDRIFTVYSESKFSNKCSATGVAIMAGSPIAMYKDDRNKKRYVTWPLPKSTRDAKKDPYADLTLDKYQAKVPETIRTSDKHILIDAKAGTGKSTTLGYSLTTLEDMLGKTCALAFGAKDAERFQELLPSSIDARTTHSFGFAAIRAHWPRVKRAKLGKPYQLLDIVVGQENRKLRDWVTSLVDKAKCDAIPPNSGRLPEVIKSYHLENEIPEEHIEQVIEHADKILKLSLDVETYGVDRNDMIWLPAILDIPLEKYDTIGLDEVQDLSRAQLIIVEKLIGLGARIIAVGDPYQSLYLFRGARADAFDHVRSLLKNTKRGVAELPMPICYRCSRAVIAAAQRLVPEIQARPDAPLGLVSNEMSLASMLEVVSPGDAIVCRTNAPGIRVARQLLEQGVPFSVRGGDKEAYTLVQFVKNLAYETGPRTEDLAELDNRLGDYLEDKAQQGVKGYWMSQYQDKVDVVRIISLRCMSVKELTKEIRKMFTPKADESTCVIISTIHRMKGGQAKRIFHIDPHRLPHPKAKSEEEKAQEFNAEYVLITRAQDDLYYVQGQVSKSLKKAA